MHLSSWRAVQSTARLPKLHISRAHFPAAAKVPQSANAPKARLDKLGQKGYNLFRFASDHCRGNYALP